MYITKFHIPSGSAETSILSAEKRTCFNTIYPFHIFPEKGRTVFTFGNITIFYGGNGSGKTTLLNLLCEKIDAIRHSEKNDSAFFERYLDACRISCTEFPEKSQFLSSDDVFDYVLNMRYLNKDIDNHREMMFKGYAMMQQQCIEDPSVRLLHGLADYDRWKDVNDAMSPRVSQSKFVKERLAKNIDMYSNGETALRYFTDHIDSDSVYLLDEPENSLSIAYQLDLKKYIEDSARHFNCQFVISTHSPIFLSLAGALIYDLDSEGVPTRKWTDLENVRKYFAFFEGYREEFLKRGD